MSRPVSQLSEDKAADFIAELLEQGAVHERIPAVASQLTGAGVINGESVRAAIQSAQIPEDQQAAVEGLVMETYAKHATPTPPSAAPRPPTTPTPARIPGGNKGGTYVRGA